MALTPDDVVTKQFQHVRFKEGFDPDEVDDFLDEIVVEWRKALAENEELKAKLAAYESGAAPAPAAAAEPVPAPAPAPAAPAVAESAPSGAASAGIIELAQRLHDEHVAEGRAQRDQLIADAKAQAAQIVSEAESRGDVCRLDLDVQGVHCAACIWLMNELYARESGGGSITVNPTLGKVRLSWTRGRLDVERFLGGIERFGYRFGPSRKQGEASKSTCVMSGGSSRPSATAWRSGPSTEVSISVSALRTS